MIMSHRSDPRAETVNSLGLTPVVNASMTDQVEEKLRQYFALQGFKPGDALPKEMELAEALQVSRNVVREALSRLRMLGMVETRKRRGMILAEPDVLSGLERLLDPNLLGKEVLKQLFEFRLVLEIGISDLLFLRRNEEDLTQLRIIVEREKNAQNDRQRVELDVLFHSTLYRISGNETLRRFQKMLIPLFNYIVEIETGPDGKTAVGSVSHSELIRVLEKGTPAEFQEAMKKHLEPHFKYI
jgi:DNA-binding FadR family transcriptional regulator